MPMNIRVLCLREENEKMMLKCIELYFIMQMFVDLLQSTHPVIIVMPNTSVKYMPKNVKDMIQIIVNNAHKICYECAKFVNGIK